MITVFFAITLTKGNDMFKIIRLIIGQEQTSISKLIREAWNFTLTSKSCKTGYIGSTGVIHRDFVIDRDNTIRGVRNIIEDINQSYTDVYSKFWSNSLNNKFIE
jgi:hypothetical protein